MHMPTLKIDKEIEIYYELSGDLESKETVVFLNGVMASASSWRQFTPAFEEVGYKILLFDFKGQVKSSKPQGPYTFADHAYELKTLLDFLGINEVNLIGTSYGGEAALKFAILFPNRVRSMVIIDSVSELDEVLRLFVKSWIDLAKSGDGEKFFYGIMPTIYSDSYIKTH
ncbi:MAG TPA: alpha/beta hydrolase, partial [Fervidobacterium sp.]|nr:alpha/beta hydrolase [Fervidobacterium sp.]